MATSPYYKQYMDQLQQGMMPDLRKQRSGMYDYLLQLAQRQGVGSAMQNVARGMAPYAEEAGQAAAQAGVQATRMGQQQEQFETQQAAWEKNRAQQQANWEKQFALQEQQADMARLMNLYNQTGVMTPEMMEQFGYGDISRSQQREMARQMEMLGFPMPGGTGINAGFNRRNPALERLGLQNPYGNPTSGGASIRSLSTPSNPFRRVTGPNQGPGLMTPRPT